MAENNVVDILKGVVSELKEMARSESIVGDPITVGDKTVIPIVKINVGFGAGGGQVVGAEGHRARGALGHRGRAGADGRLAGALGQRANRAFGGQHRTVGALDRALGLRGRAGRQVWRTLRLGGRAPGFLLRAMRPAPRALRRGGRADGELGIRRAAGLLDRALGRNHFIRAVSRLRALGILTHANENRL